mgnify:CR=1 FL=1
MQEQMTGPSSGLPTLAQAQALADTLMAVAQAEYNQWDEADVDTYGGGGICHLIADRLAAVLEESGIEASSVSSSNEEHTYAACQLAEGVFILNIPHGLYEIGGGCSWTKIAGVTFTEHSLVWYQVDPDPNKFAAYIDANPAYEECDT